MTWIPPHKVRSTDLTTREFECLRMLVEGLDNASMGRALFLSEDTIKTHLRRLYRKLDVGNRVEAVVEAMRRGMIPCACGRRYNQEVVDAVQRAAQQREQGVLTQNNRAL